MRSYLCAVLAGSILASGSAYAQETEEGELAPAVSGTPMTISGPYCGRRAGEITKSLYVTENGFVTEFSREGEIYGYTVYRLGEDGIMNQYSLADFDGDGLYERVEAEDVVCPRD